MAQVLHNNHTQSLLLLRYAVAVPPFMGYAFLLFSLAYIGKKLHSKVLWLIVPAIVASLSWTSLSVTDAAITKYGIAIKEVGVLYAVILLYSAVAFGKSVRLLYRHYAGHRKELGSARDLMLIFSITQLLLTVIFGSIFLTNNSLSQILVPISAFIMVGIVTYGITRMKLFDIRSVVIRGTAYIFTLLLLALLYIAPAVYIMGVGIMGFPFEPTKFAVGVVFATFAALYFENLRQWFNVTTSKIFFRDAYDSAVVLGELNKILVSTIDLNTLLHKSSALIANTLKAEFCLFVLKETANQGPRYIGTVSKKLSQSDALQVSSIIPEITTNVIIGDYIDDEHRELKGLLTKNDSAVLIRLSTNSVNREESLGYILLGYKRSGNSYTNKDAQALETMADVLSLAIQNALHFEEIQNFNITLQQRIEAATRQLRRTNAKLEALDETKDDFISMASHQLRTPLTAVKGYISMVLEGDAGKITPTQKQMLAQAFMSSQRMVFLIADLLNVSRLKTGKFVIDAAPINLADLIEEEIGQLRETAHSSGLELKYDKPKDFPDLMLDETKTRQVLMNYIDNAIHYTRAGGHIRVELTEKPQTVELKVIDDGIGVPKSEQHHLFTKFYRAGNARRQRPDGTGLGLFMAKKVVVAQAGAVIFESKENAGSIFGFTLPKQKLMVRPGA